MLRCLRAHGSRRWSPTQRTPSRSSKRSSGHRERLVALGMNLVLVVVHIGEGRIVERGQDRVALSRAERSHEPQMLDRNGIALLRHDRTDLHVTVRKPQLPDLEGGPERHVLCNTAEIERHDLQRRIGAGRVVARGDAAIGIQQDVRRSRAVPPCGRGLSGNRWW